MALDSGDDAQQVLLEELSAVIDITVLAGFSTAVYCLRRRDMAVCTLCHALSVALITFTTGHYLEAHVYGSEGTRDLVLFPSRQVAQLAATPKALARNLNMNCCCDQARKSSFAYCSRKMCHQQRGNICRALWRSVDVRMAIVSCIIASQRSEHSGHARGGGGAVSGRAADGAGALRA
jgi:hypothetical protein